MTARQGTCLAADKGRATVILNKEDYIRKCNEHLENGPYIKIKKDPTNNVVSQITRKLSILGDNELIDQQQYLKRKPTGTQPSRFYGLPKIHKDGISVCPIVSCTGTPLYEVSKYIAEIPKPYGKQKEQHTNNSKSFSTFIRQQTIEPNKIIVSFEVTSLYTTIPIDQALLIIEDLLQHDDKLADLTPLSPNQILDLLSEQLISNSTTISTDGASMGGPTSAIVSEIYMQALEMTAITTADHPPKIWGRYVDYIFSVIQRIYLQELLHHINSLHPQTQFTKEEEKDSILPFLDTLVQRNPDKNITVKVNRKPTHTNHYLNYASHRSTSAKQSVITALFDRADNVVSSEADKEEEKQHILAALQQSGYPRDLMKTVTQQNRSNRRRIQAKQENQLPYNQGESEQLRRTFNKYNIKTTFYTPTTLRSLLSKPKDPILKEDRNDVIYQLDCTGICTLKKHGTSKHTYRY